MKEYNDLISRDELLEAIDKERSILIEENRLGAEHIVVHHARRIIEDMPPVDAVSIVRCKDCKFFGSVDGCNWLTCKKGILTGWSNRGYGFCSIGERMVNSADTRI